MRTLASLSVLLCAVGLSAQTITITFEASANNTPTPLDSVLVMNLTQGGDTTIYFPDNVLVLAATSVGELGSRMAGLVLCAPNPFVGGTEILVQNSGRGELMLMIHDALGREVASQRVSSAPGLHSFRFTAAMPGGHVITFVQDGARRTTRMVALEGSANGVAALSYMGASGSTGPWKSDRTLFTWTSGDELRYIGYATIGEVLHSAAIDEAPVASSTRTFILAAGTVCPDSPTVTDIDGNIYRSVRIGDQCWMAENLRTTKYSNGTPIPPVASGNTWWQLTTGAWCNYQNSNGNGVIYGKLYNGYAAMTSGICPLGWHAPSESDWQQLEVTLGMPTNELDQIGWRGGAQNVGGKLKATTLWTNPNAGATNESGFSMLPGGFRDPGSLVFDGIGDMSYFWSSTESDFGGHAWVRVPYFNLGGLGRDRLFWSGGACIRCLKD